MSVGQLSMMFPKLGIKKARIKLDVRPEHLKAMLLKWLVSADVGVTYLGTEEWTLIQLCRKCHD